MPFFRGEMTLADPHQRINLSPRRRRKCGDGFPQCRELRIARRERLETQGRGRIVLAARGLLLPQCLFPDTAEERVPLRTRGLCEDRDEAGLIQIKVLKHGLLP